MLCVGRIPPPACAAVPRPRHAVRFSVCRRRTGPAQCHRSRFVRCRDLPDHIVLAFLPRWFGDVDATALPVSPLRIGAWLRRELLPFHLRIHHPLTGVSLAGIAPRPPLVCGFGALDSRFYGRQTITQHLEVLDRVPWVRLGGIALK